MRSFLEFFADTTAWEAFCIFPLSYVLALQGVAAVNVFVRHSAPASFAYLQAMASYESRHLAVSTATFHLSAACGAVVAGWPHFLAVQGVVVVVILLSDFVLRDRYMQRARQTCAIYEASLRLPPTV